MNAEAGASLRAMLHDLWDELAGGEAGAGPAQPNGLAATHAAAAAAAGAQQQLQQQRREVALLQLHFCEAVMQLFEREGAPEGAALFAAAALEHLRTAYGCVRKVPCQRGSEGAVSRSCTYMFMVAHRGQRRHLDTSVVGADTSDTFLTAVAQVLI